MSRTDRTNVDYIAKQVSFSHSVENQNEKIIGATGEVVDEQRNDCPEENGYNGSESATSLPLVCLSDGLSRKANAFSLASWVALSLTLDGRDKITKTIQYTCRFIAWYYESVAKAPTATVAPYRNLQKALTNARKAFRLGKFLIEYQKLKKLLPGVRDNVARRPSVLRLMDSFYSIYGDKASSVCFQNDGAVIGRRSSTPLWKSAGLSFKLLGLAGFWTGDNIFYLSSSGFIETVDKSRVKKFAERSYFFAALVGLFVSFKEIKAHRTVMRDAYNRLEEATRRELDRRRMATLERDDNNDGASEASAEFASDSDSEDESDEAKNALTEAKSRQFVLFLALLKSVCDTLVFSNNPGVNLHMRFRGKKMHEGFHCLCGLTSAATVLYNNFPNKSQEDTPIRARNVPPAERRKMFRKHNFASSNWYSPM